MLIKTEGLCDRFGEAVQLCPTSCDSMAAGMPLPAKTSRSLRKWQRRLAEAKQLSQT